MTIISIEFPLDHLNEAIHYTKRMCAINHIHHDPYIRGTSVDGSFLSRANSSCTNIPPKKCASAFLLLLLTVDVRLHNLIKVGLVNDSAGLGTLGFLLQVLAEEVEIELAIFDLWACLEAVPEMY
jgi:hypothetical protein